MRARGALLGRDTVLQDAIADARVLESDELRAMILELLMRRRMLMLESTDSEDRKEAAMLKQELQRFKKAMRDEGRREAMAKAILRICEARKLPLADAERSHVLACTDLAQRERWHERAITAASVGDVLDLARSRRMVVGDSTSSLSRPRAARRASTDKGEAPGEAGRVGGPTRAG